MALLTGFAIGAPIGLVGGLLLKRGVVVALLAVLARKQEALSYSAQELNRRKGGALDADLRFHRIDRGTS